MLFLYVPEFKELNELITNVNLFIKIFLKKVDLFSQEEEKYSNDMRKFAYAKEDIKQNQDLSFNNLEFLRSRRGGLTRLDFENEYFNSKINIKKGDLIDKKNLKKK